MLWMHFVPTKAGSWPHAAVRFMQGNSSRRVYASLICSRHEQGLTGGGGCAGAAGVSVDALEQAAEKSGKGASSGAVTRSGTALIIKNLPYSAEEKELQVRHPAVALCMSGSPGVSRQTWSQNAIAFPDERCLKHLRNIACELGLCAQFQ